MSKSQIRDYLLAPGSQVFGGDPERGSSSGIVPPDTEIRVQITNFPSRRTLYCHGTIEEVKCVATPERFVIGPQEVSAGGFTLYPYELIYFSADYIRDYSSTKLPRPH